MKIIAHRCGPELHPQLTIAAAKRALEVGAALVEMDVRYTSDGLAVLNHDDNTNYLFGCDRKVAEMTAAEFLALRHVTDVSYASHSVEHFLRSDVKDILFHCKIGGAPLYQVLELCREYGALDRVVFGVERLADVRIVKGFDPAVRALAFMPDAPTVEGTAQNIRDFAAAGADYIRLWEGWDVDTLHPIIRACGKKTWIMANNPTVCNWDCGYTTTEALRRFRDMGIDGVLVNDPSKAVPALES